MSRAAKVVELDDYLSRHRTEVERALTRAVGRLTEALPTEVASAVDHGVTSGGKRLRPVLCVAGFQACGGVAVEALYDLAASLELIHAYSLMHDDLPCMDDAELRRGQPTTHVVYGDETTVRAGAALIPAAAALALDAARALGRDDAGARAVSRALLEAAGGGGMVGGQWLDLRGEGRALGPSELDALHRHKTGALLAASLEIGARAAAAPAPRVDALLRYGRAIGLAFQITDDILDATQTAETLGKRPSDTELAKSTYVALYGLDEARARARARIDHAIEALDGAGIDSPILRALADFVIEREK